MASSFRRAGAWRLFATTALFILVASTTTLAAQSLTDSVQIHGFGGWAYAETDGNYYTIGLPDGSWDNADFALNITAEPMEKLSIVAQIRGEAVNGEDNFELDYAFAGWSFTDELEVRIGRVKHPFGIYGEIFDVGTLRPFFYLAQGVYGPVGQTARAYNGVGLAGWHDWDSGWGLQYDVYFGQIEGDYTVPGAISGFPEDLFESKVDIGFEVNNTFGARITVNTPVPGLDFGFSGYSGDDLLMSTQSEVEATRNTLLGSLSFVRGPWHLRAEYGQQEREQTFKSKGGYVEAAFKFADHWQVAARYDMYDLELLEFDLGSVPSFFENFFEHEDLTVGVNYWFGSNFVVRLSYSRVEGNRFALASTPEDVYEMFVTGALENNTDMVLFGAQFSF